MPLGPVADDVQHHHGFLHRLDVPSSGLILVAKTYLGLLRPAGARWRHFLIDVVRSESSDSHLWPIAAQWTKLAPETCGTPEQI